jgi:hypothetical protein
MIRTFLWAPMWALALPLMGLVGLPGRGDAASSAQYGPMYTSLEGEVLLDNPRVFVQKFIVRPGQSTGRRTHPGDQLLVFVKGGVLTSHATGRSTLWRAGRAVWHDGADGADEGSTNTGTTPIEMIWVTLKPVASSPAAATPGSTPKYRYLNYPNIPGEDLLENDQVIVQRFTVGRARPPSGHALHTHQGRSVGSQIEARAGTSVPHAVAGWRGRLDAHDRHQRRTRVAEYRQRPDRLDMGDPEEVALV